MDAQLLASTTLNGISVLVVGATLIIMRQQAREMSRQSRAMRQSHHVSGVDVIGSAVLEVLRMFADYPRTRALLIVDERPPLPLRYTVDDVLRARTLAECILDQIEYAMATRPDGTSPWMDDYLREWFCDVLRNSPYTAGVLVQRSNWYAPALVDLVRDIIREMGWSEQELLRYITVDVWSDLEPIVLPADDGRAGDSHTPVPAR
jgi:hypothetical protein